MRAHVRPAVAIAGATVAMWAFAFTTPRNFIVGTFVDDAYYAVLAKSIRERGQYRAIHLPDAPVETKYPPLHPMALALAWNPDLGNRENLERIRWVNLVLVGPLAGALTYFGIAALEIAPVAAGALSVLALLAPRTASLWVIPLSEPLFLLAATLGFALLARGRHLWGLALLVLSAYARSIGVAFVVGALIVLVRPNARRSLRLLACAAAGFLPWIIWQMVNSHAIPDFMLGLHGSYARWYLSALQSDPVTLLFVVPAKNAIDILLAVGSAIFRASWLDDWFRNWLPWLGSAAVIGVAVFLGWRVWRMRVAVPWLVAGLIAYGVVTLIWPYPPVRFVSGVWPLVLLAAAASLRRRADLLALAACLTAGIGIARDDTILFHRIRSRIAVGMMAHIVDRVPANAVLATTNPPLHYLFLEVPTVPAERLRSYSSYRADRRTEAWGDAGDVWPIFDHYRPNLVAVERRGTEGIYAIRDLDEACPGLLTKDWESVDGEMLYRVSYDVPCNPGNQR